ncbi:5-formyltetrahydrofolate cyclo-ligase [Glaciecola sp. MH2013]|uniref:5-formyltetrahydrofolate cyclo-ligase n=1 Tax=Glaciecola sp. MH2013 TaxID=2785524 RepID=UPI00189DE099|nr:5-formyltetrahydrofolate cyclo-ligase [Glaciecola sp. MH2013]MBF7072078.1 5-formyltetrahydrofolate cyclo-ligase [Glaciecola sp. MH2013]
MHCKSTRASSSELRSTLRSEFRAQRQQINKSDHSRFASNLAKRAHTHIFSDFSKPSHASTLNVATYLSFDGELDTRVLIESTWALGHRVFLPILHPFAKGHLLFQVYDSTTKMTKNRFGISEPALNVQKVLPCSELDVLFTPLVAFDDKGNRLGMGGGFYDRTLSALYNKEQGKTRVVGLALDQQKANQLPKETWDIPLPEVLTPSQHYIFA